MTKRCTCEQCARMKNPRPVHNEASMQEGFLCHFLIMRDGRTQKYAATMLVEVGDGRTLQSGSEFTLLPGTKQEDAVRAIIEAAVEGGVLDELLCEATLLRHEDTAGVQQEVTDIKALARKLEADMTRMLQQDMANGAESPLEALRARAEAMDPFRPVKPKAKTYLN